ncbi:hypothetical protein QO058_09365 [Bosea vestrisii]|uniref:hypothetical protein n=1 Tax=Bosea vestrisii TaxID=151416 RepID=UPI0024DF7835|nr:hypothetical protein [Bosea vestrisii]WID98420.1 hypothetical protein QO058_09365 [Bosea vestrisii]
MEDGFKVMSQKAEGGSSQDGPSDRLNAYGVDTDVMTEAATERVSELQQLIIDEVRARPLRALGWAAAVGVVFGFWAAR